MPQGFDEESLFSRSHGDANHETVLSLLIRTLKAMADACERQPVCEETPVKSLNVWRPPPPRREAVCRLPLLRQV